MPTETGSPERQISRGIVAIYKDYTGRGPAHARTTISDECSTTIVRESLTKAEIKLVEKGEAPTVRDMRRKFQEAMCDDIMQLVGTVTGRETATMLSDHHPVDDLAVETVTFKRPVASD